MKKLLYYLPFHFVLLLVIGIYLQYTFFIWTYGWQSLLGLFILLLVAVLILKSNRVATLLCFVLFFFMGISTAQLHDARAYDNYFKKVSKENAVKVLHITKNLKDTPFYNKYEAEVIQVDTTKTRGKVLLNISKAVDSAIYNVDDQIVTSTDVEEPPKPLNPHQFDYSAYLKTRGIHHQITLRDNKIFKVKKGAKSLMGMADEFREKIQNQLKVNGFKEDVFGVMNALLLGQRDEISEEVLTNYAKAGAIHILAVSGLHVGILLLLFTKLFSPLTFFKNGKYIRTAIVVVLLWAFACIAGLSASVVRAVSMFTFVAIGMVLQRKNAIEFSLIASAFFLLLFKPSFLFDVGFQMSYLAVFGIVWFQPQFQKIWNPKYIFLKKVWQLFTVSCAAQLGVLPLSLYYFHQFPSLFFLSNLVIVPFLGVLLLIGISLIVLSFFVELPVLFVEIYQFIVHSMNSFIGWVASKEGFLIGEISFSLGQMLFVYAILFAVLILLYKTTFLRLALLCWLIISFQIFSIYKNDNRSDKNEFIIFHKNKSSLYGYHMNRRLFLNRIEKDEKLIQDYLVGEGILLSDVQPYPNVIKINDVYLLIVDQLGVYAIEGLKSPKVLLTQSPKINLERLIKYIQPSEIIADGSNYKSYVNHWKAICEQHGVPFYATGEFGAYRSLVSD